MDNSRHVMYLVEESLFGITPTDPDFARIRATGTTLGLTKGSSKSEEQNPNRQVTGFRHTTEELGGDMNFELSYGSQDAFLEAVLGSTFGTEVAASSLVAVVEDAGGDQLVLSAGTWAALGKFYAGQSVTVAGFTEGANNATFIIKSVTPTTITVTSTDMAAEAEGDAVTVTADEELLAVGTDRTSFSILRHFSDQEDADKPYHLHTGVELNTLNLTVTPEARVTGSVGTSGQSVDPKDDAEWATVLGSGSLGLPSTTEVFDAFSGTVTEGGNLNACVTEISLTLENGLENRFVVGARTSKLPSIGESNLTGTLTVFFEDASLLEKFYDEVESSLQFTLLSPDGDEYTFVIPAFKFTGGQPDSQGKTGSITLALPFQAFEHDGTGTNLLIERNPA